LAVGRQRVVEPLMVAAAVGRQRVFAGAAAAVHAWDLDPMRQKKLRGLMLQEKLQDQLRLVRHRGYRGRLMGQVRR